MSKKDMVFYALIAILLLLFLWQWFSKGALLGQLSMQLSELQKDNKDIMLLSGVGPLRSAHNHADVKVYINGKAIDFSQSKYQLAARFIHFEEGIGDVIHTHATGLTIGHLFKSLGADFGSNCLAFEEADYCNGGNARLRFYVNGKPNDEFDNYVIKDLDKILVSYGNESEEELQKQLNSVTNLAAKYSANRYS
ncbi:hypothetical protein HYX06_05400 [Candidatus Woesearchaeota archaeon]|nr:hypothetical protein [Candidatus Woesearchaeota archaeon]